MTSQQEIEIEIGPDGDTKVHVKGAKGKKCMDYVVAFQRVLGKLKEKKPTAEYYEPETHVHTDLKGGL